MILYHGSREIVQYPEIRKAGKYMGRKNNNNLFYTCSLIEYIGRKVKQTRLKQ